MSQNPLSFRISGSVTHDAITKSSPDIALGHRNKIVPTDPKIWGPITWYNIHTMAFAVTEENEIKVFIKLLRSICDKLPCNTCKEHAKTFLLNNPPEKEIGSIPSKCFKYTVDFHNHANLMTGGSLLSFDEAFKLYNSKESIFEKLASKPYSPVKTIEDLGLTSVGRSDKKSGKETKEIKEVRRLDPSYFD